MMMADALEKKAAETELSDQDIAEQIRKDVAAFWDTEEGRAAKLKLDLAWIVLRNLKGRQWSPEDLAKRTTHTSEEILDIMHADRDVDTEEIGAILHAFGIHAELYERKTQ